MKAPQLKTTNDAVILIEPIVERDAALGVAWLQGDEGRRTLQLMGVPDKNIRPTTLQAERERIQSFIDGQSQLNWMIRYKGTVIGTTWVNLTDVEDLPAPSVHIMIGDPAARGKGIGSAALSRVLAHLADEGCETVHSRYLLSNVGSKKLLHGLGFKDINKQFADKDGLIWQQVIRTL